MKQNVVTCFIGFFIIVLGMGIQMQLNFSGDVSYLLFALKQLLQGGHYGREIFETNPPMILYLYLPPLLLYQFFDISLMGAMRLYLFLMGMLSAATCFYLIKKCIASDFLTLLLMVTLFIVFFILPLQEFAQREHWFIILLFPYLFLSIARLEKVEIRTGMALSIGVFAGFGFSLKPFFLITLLLIEIVMIQKRVRFRIEFCAVVVIFIFYLLSIFIFQPEYIRAMLPWVTHYYFPFATQTLKDFFSPPYVLFCIAMAFSYVIFYAFDRLRSTGVLLWFALIGNISAFMCAKTSWYYHVIPALALSYMLVAFYIGQICSTYKTAIMAAVFICMIPFYNHFLMFQYGMATHQSTKKVADLTRGAKSIICLPLGTRDCFPLMDFIHAEYGSHFPSLWWLKGMRSLEKTEDIKQDKTYFLKQLGADLQFSKADYVIVNTMITSMDFLIPYLEQDQRFQTTWRQYHFKNEYNEYQIYERNAT